MRIDLFQMERTQCLYENEVEFNLSESGVLPLRVEDLLEGSTDPDWLHRSRLKYPPSRGSETLRDRIALFHGAGCTREHVMVTNGGSEANYVALWGLLGKGDRAAVMIPNYLQGRGLARAYAGRADLFRLVERSGGGKRRWGLDVDGLERAVGPRTRLILVTNPNNPAGSVLTEDEMGAVVRVARRARAWIVSDEVYRGAELSGRTTPTFWGRYQRVLITGGLSKAFGLPGLRTGWIVGPPKTVARLCSYHDYLTLTPTYLSNRFAEIVLEPARREAILERTRSILRLNLPRLESWIRTHDGVLDLIPPEAGAIALVRYDLPIGSVALFDRLRREQSVLITPGAHFGIGRYLRIGYGDDPEHLSAGLSRIDVTLADLRRRPAGRNAAGSTAARRRRTKTENGRGSGGRSASGRRRPQPVAG